MTVADETHPGRPIRVHVLTPGLKAVIVFAVAGFLFIPRDPEHNLEQRRVLGTHPAVIWTLAFSPDGQVLGVGGSDGSVGLWDVTARRCTLAVPPPPSLPCGLAFKPDLSAVAVAGPGPNVNVRDLATGRELLDSPYRVQAFHALTYAPDGSTLAEGRDDGIHRAPPRHGPAEDRCLRRSSGITVLKFAPRGRSLAAADMSGMVMLWDLKTADRSRGSTPPSRRWATCSSPRTAGDWSSREPASPARSAT